MANWSILKAAISNAIKENGNQEITGPVLQNVLTNIVSTVGGNASYAGIATPITNPGIFDGPVFYFALTKGTYSNFGGLVLNDSLYILSNVTGTWTATDLNVKISDAISTANEAKEAATNAETAATEAENAVNSLTSNLGKANGIATLGNSGRLNANQIPRTCVLAKNFAKIETGIILVNPGKYEGTQAILTEVIYTSRYKTFVQKVTLRGGTVQYYADWNGSNEFSTVVSENGVKPIPGKIYKASSDESLYCSSDANELLPLQVNKVLALGENDDEAFPGDRGYAAEQNIKVLSKRILEIGGDLLGQFTTPVKADGIPPQGIPYGIYYFSDEGVFVAVEETGNDENPKYYITWIGCEVYGEQINNGVKPVSGKLYYDKSDDIVYAIDNTGKSGNHRLAPINYWDFEELLYMSESIVPFYAFVNVEPENITNRYNRGPLCFNNITSTFVVLDEASGTYSSKSDNRDYESLGLEPSNTGYIPADGLLYFTQEDNKFYIKSYNGILSLADNTRLLFGDMFLDAVGEYGTIDKTHTEDGVLKPYMCNGIWMTYKEALHMYTLTNKLRYGGWWFTAGALSGTDLKTCLPIRFNEGNSYTQLTHFVRNCKNLEVLRFDVTKNANNGSVQSVSYAFMGCTKLKHIYGELNVSYQGCGFNSSGLDRCTLLETLKLDGLNEDLNLSGCKNISLESLAYIVNNRYFPATNVKAITLTVHFDVYAKLTDDSGTYEEWHNVYKEAADKNIQFVTNN